MTALTAEQLADLRGDLGIDSNVQLVTLTGSPTGGTFTLSYQGATTAAIGYNAPASTVQTALAALSTVGSGNVEVIGAGPYRIKFIETLADVSVSLLTGSGAGLTGGTSPSVSVAIDLMFSDAELNRFWTRASEDYAATVVYGLRNLLASAVKLHHFAFGSNSEDPQQVREGLEKLLDRWEKTAGLSGGELRTGSILLGLDETGEVA